jgi:hypothetical protein
MAASMTISEAAEAAGLTAVRERLAEMERHLDLIDFKIDTYREKL